MIGTGLFLALSILVGALVLDGSNTAPSDPAAISCNGGECAGSFSGQIQLLCTGSVDADNDAVSYSYDALHNEPLTTCGSNMCGYGEQCVSDFCACGGTGPDCTSGQICCGTMCIDVNNDMYNCGGCGIACGASQQCIGGKCCDGSTGCGSEVPSGKMWSALGSAEWNTEGISDADARVRCRASDTSGWSNYIESGSMQVNFVSDADNDGVVDKDDKCAGTVLPDTAELKPQKYADVDGDKILETYDAKTKTIVDANFVTTSGVTYGPLTLKETFGCSCKQILENRPDLSDGSMKLGCKTDAINEWITA